MGKPTVHDIAREAGVSLAVVDRVLNDRPGVRAVTVEKVRAAVRKLGYVHDLPAAEPARQRRYRFAFLVPDSPSLFMRGLRDAIDETGRLLMADRAEVTTRAVSFADPGAVESAFAALERDSVDGVAVMAGETPLVQYWIERLKDRGLAVVALVSDQPRSARDDFIGLDNQAAGRTAGVLMGRFLGSRSGRVAVVVNTMQARDMVQRRLGFDQVLRAGFPRLSALPSVEGHDDHELTAKLTAKTLERNGDIVGLYCVAAGLRGVTQALRERRLGRSMVVIAHDLTPHSRDALMDGTVDALINQDVGHIARSAVRTLCARCDGAEVIPSQERIRVEILLKENLP